MSKKSVISGIFLVVGLAALSGKAHYDKAEQEHLEQEHLEQQQMEDEIPYYPLNGTFTCEYYKAKTQVMEGISWYSVSETSRGWNWMFSMEDDTAIFYTQTAGQFCYVKHVGEEE